MRSLRERNRHNAMRTTQRAALDLFEADGFEHVTVAAIADAVGMAASTIYRHFDTKEAIVLWDEHDGDLDGAFLAAFTSRPPLDALRSVFVEELGPRYDDDLAFQLRRVQYIYETEAVHLAAGEASYQETLELTDAVRQVLSKENQPAAPILVGAAMAALDAAFDQWQQANGATSLGTLIDEAFDVLTGLDDLR